MDDEKPLVTVPDRGRRSLEDTHQELVAATSAPDERSLHSIATLRLPTEMRAVLEEPIPVEDLDILPTGEVYASQVQYRRRLTKVFGPGGWAMVERSQPRLEHNTVIQQWGLYAQGALISTAWGEQEYFPQNPRMSYATALESAKSNALMRCCKDLAIASECWDRHFTEWFKEEHCVAITVAQYGGGGARKLWRRKDGQPFAQERQPEERVSVPVSATGSSPTSPPLTARSRAAAAKPAPAIPKINPDLAKDLAKMIEDVQESLQSVCQMFGVERLEDLTTPQYDKVVEIVQRKRGNNPLKLD